jgi:aromatic ring-cleaving dioxygenase
MEISIDIFLALISLFVAIIIGVITVFIQKRQTSIQKDQLKSDLFEKRYEVYLSFKRSFGDNDDKMYSIIHFKNLHDDYICWFNSNNDQLKILFHQEVFQQANELYNSIKIVTNKYDENIDLEPFREKYQQLKNIFVNELKFNNIKK